MSERLAYHQIPLPTVDAPLLPAAPGTAAALLQKLRHEELTRLDFAVQHNEMEGMTQENYPHVSTATLFEALAATARNHENFIPALSADDTWDEDVKAKARGRRAGVIREKNELARRLLTDVEPIYEMPQAEPVEEPEEEQSMPEPMEEHEPVILDYAGFKYPKRTPTDPIILPMQPETLPLTADDTES